VTTFTQTPGAGQKVRASVLGTEFSELQIFHRDRQTLTGSAASVTFTVPSNLRKLTITHATRADPAVSTQAILMRINNDATANYYYQIGQASNATASAAATSASTSGSIGLSTGASASANVFGSGEVTLAGWDQSHAGAVQWSFTSQALGAVAANFVAQYGGGVYLVAGPYTSITFLPASGNFVAGSDFQLYGLIA